MWARYYASPDGVTAKDTGRTLEEIDARASAVLKEHIGMFRAERDGIKNDSLGELLHGLLMEFENGNDDAVAAIAFLAREAMGILQAIGCAGTVVDIAGEAADWARRWASDPENADGVRVAGQLRLSWPVNIESHRGGKLTGELKAAVDFVNGLGLGSAFHDLVKASKPHSDDSDGALFRRWLIFEATTIEMAAALGVEIRPRLPAPESDGAKAEWTRRFADYIIEQEGAKKFKREPYTKRAQSVVREAFKKLAR